MSGGMEPGISIFRVMTRSAPVVGGEEMVSYHADSKRVYCANARPWWWWGGVMEVLQLTLSADAPQICDFHQHLGEHVWLVRPPFPHVDLESL